MMPLPDKADSPIPKLRDRFVSMRFQRFRIKVYCTARWGVQRGKQMQQSTFARAGRSDDRDHFARAKHEIDSVQTVMASGPLP